MIWHLALSPAIARPIRTVTLDDVTTMGYTTTTELHLIVERFVDFRRLPAVPELVVFPWDLRLNAHYPDPAPTPLDPPIATVVQPTATTELPAAPASAMALTRRDSQMIGKIEVRHLVWIIVLIALAFILAIAWKRMINGVTRLEVERMHNRAERLEREAEEAEQMRQVRVLEEAALELDERPGILQPMTPEPAQENNALGPPVRQRTISPSRLEPVQYGVANRPGTPFPDDF